MFCFEHPNKKIWRIIKTPEDIAYNQDPAQILEPTRLL